MKKSILVSLTLSSLVFAGGAQASHNKGTHKGHVHKEVGGGDCCDELRKQIEDLNASYQERFESIEAKVEELDELAHDHDTLLLDPPEGSWTLGFDVWWPDTHGGDSQIFGLATDANGAAGAGGLSLAGVARTVLDDDTAWSASVRFQATDDSSYLFQYTDLDQSQGYGPFAASGFAPGATGPDQFITTPTGQFFLGEPIPNAFTFAAAFRSLDVDDMRFERENRVWANRKFAVNWSWGIRHAEIDDLQSAVYTLDDVDVATGADTNTLTVDRRSNFDGWGPSVGLKGRYYITEDIELQGSWGAAALVGDQNFRHVQTEDVDPFDGIAPSTTVDTANNTTALNPVMDLQSRLVWHASDDLDLHVGYSATRYFDAITSDFGFETVKKDLSIEGIRAGIEWNFD